MSPQSRKQHHHYIPGQDSTTNTATSHHKSHLGFGPDKTLQCRCTCSSQCHLPSYSSHTTQYPKILILRPAFSSICSSDSSSTAVPLPKPRHRLCSLPLHRQRLYVILDPSNTRQCGGQSSLIPLTQMHTQSEPSAWTISMMSFQRNQHSQHILQM
jgi:hypothetical protein